MKKFRKQFIRLTAITTAFLVTASAANFSFAASVKNESKAKILNKLGLFQGVSQTEFVPALDESLTREQAMKMILTVLGTSKEAEAAKLPCSFRDVSDWAKPYVAYAASKNIAKGTSDTEFGAQESITGVQLYTFYLRALGYEEPGTNVYNEAASKALSVGLIKNAAEGSDVERAFIRDDLVGVSYNALYVKRKGTQNSLIAELLNAKAVSKDIIAGSGDDGLLASINTGTAAPAAAAAQPTPAAQPATQPAAGAYIDFKASNTGSKLQQYSTGDNTWYGYTEATTKEGVECRKIPTNGEKGGRLVMTLDDDYMLPTNTNCTIKITYFDAGKDKIRVSYSTETKRYAELWVLKTDSKTWKTETFKVTDAKIANQQDGKMDFTIWAEYEGGAGTEEYISRFEVINGSAPASGTTPAPTATPAPSASAAPTPAAGGTSTAAPATGDGAVIEFKATNAGKKLQQYITGDNTWYGYTEPITKEGVECRRIPLNGEKSGRLVMTLDDDYMLPTDKNCTIKITYFDAGKDKVRVSYSTETKRYAELWVQKTDSKTWKTETFKVTDAKIANQQDGKMDFSIWAEYDSGAGTDEFISKFEVIKQ